MRFPNYLLPRQKPTPQPDPDTPKDTESLLQKERFLVPSQLDHPKRSLFTLALLFFGLLGYLVAAITLSLWLRCTCTCNELVYSPAQDIIKYKRVTLDNALGAESPFVGEPRPELHAAWRSILRYMNTRVSAADLEKINKTSTPLHDEQGGFLVTLDVFHQLHCLNMLREQIYREHYPTKHTMESQLEHTNHCIDMLREVLMCHGDVVMQTNTWIDDYRWPWPDFRIDHQCRDWDAIVQWAEEHRIHSLMGPIVQHPTLGVSWRGDEEY